MNEKTIKLCTQLMWDRMFFGLDPVEKPTLPMGHEKELESYNPPQFIRFPNLFTGKLCEMEIKK